MRKLTPILGQFARDVINEARINLTKGDRNVTNKLMDSMTFTVDEKGDGLYAIDFIMEYYGKFVDKGVSGTQKKYNTPFSYRRKGGKRGLKGMPPPSAFDGWRVKRGIAPRDDKGRFLPRKAANFAIAKSVFEKGIKPSLFFTRPFDKYFTDLSQVILDNFDLEIRKTFKKLEKDG